MLGVGGNTQPKEMIEICFLSHRIVIFIIIALFPLLRTLKPLLKATDLIEFNSRVEKGPGTLEILSRK